VFEHIGLKIAKMSRWCYKRFFRSL